VVTQALINASPQPGRQILASASSDTTVLTWISAHWLARPMPRRVLTDRRTRSRWASLDRSGWRKSAFRRLSRDLLPRLRRPWPFLSQTSENQPQHSTRSGSTGSSPTLGTRHLRFAQQAIAALLQHGARRCAIHRQRRWLPDQSWKSKLRLKKIRDQLTSLLLTRRGIGALSRAVGSAVERIGTPKRAGYCGSLATEAPGALTTTAFLTGALDRSSRTDSKPPDTCLKKSADFHRKVFATHPLRTEPCGPKRGKRRGHGDSRPDCHGHRGSSRTMAFLARNLKMKLTRKSTARKNNRESATSGSGVGGKQLRGHNAPDGLFLARNLSVSRLGQEGSQDPDNGK